MAKMKTNKAVKSRFKLTGSNKLKRRCPALNHLLTKKSRKRKRQLKNPQLVAKGHSKVYLKMMGI